MHNNASQEPLKLEGFNWLKIFKEGLEIVENVSIVTWAEVLISAFNKFF